MDSKQAALPERRQSSNVKVPAQWAKLLRRLMALQDGQHQIVINVDNGTVAEWSMLIRAKPEK